MVFLLLNQVKTSELRKVCFILDLWDSSYWKHEQSYEQRKFKVIAYTDTLHVGGLSVTIQESWNQHLWNIIGEHLLGR